VYVNCLLGILYIRPQSIVLCSLTSTVPICTLHNPRDYAGEGGLRLMSIIRHVLSSVENWKFGNYILGILIYWSLDLLQFHERALRNSKVTATIVTLLHCNGTSLFVSALKCTEVPRHSARFVGGTYVVLIKAHALSYVIKITSFHWGDVDTSISSSQHVPPRTTGRACFPWLWPKYTHYWSEVQLLYRCQDPGLFKKAAWN
jgi:hypothetical protein